MRNVKKYSFYAWAAIMSIRTVPLRGLEACLSEEVDPTSKALFSKQHQIFSHFFTFYHIIYLFLFFSKKKHIKSFTFYITSFTLYYYSNKKSLQNKIFHFPILSFYFLISIIIFLFFLRMNSIMLVLFNKHETPPKLL
jgi:hypothetical protein